MIMQDEKKITHIVTRGQVWLADLGANVGSEQSGIRPVLVIQNNKGCKYSSTFTICPLTSKKINKHLPTHVILKNEIFLPEISVALIEQTRTIDRGRFIKMLGTTNDNIMIEIDKAIKVHMGLLNEFSYDEAYELLEQIKDIEDEIKERGNTQRLIRMYNRAVNKLKKYCNDHGKNYKIIIQQYQDQNKVSHAI